MPGRPQGMHFPGGHPPKLEKGSFLGVITSPASPALQQQLKLPRGTGLVVEMVEPGSPAEAAGLKQYDLLIRLNEQLLINPQQLAVLVRTYKPADEVQLTYIHEGQSQTATAKLVEKDLPVIGDNILRERPMPPPQPLVSPPPQSQPAQHDDL